MAIENARLAGAHHIIFTHYNLKHSDNFLDDLKEKYKNEITDIDCIFAKEKAIYEFM